MLSIETFRIGQGPSLQRTYPPPPSLALCGRARRAWISPTRKSLFIYKKGKWSNRLIFLERDGQFLSVNGQIRVFNGQKVVENLVKN